MRKLLIVLAMLAMAEMAAAQTADDYRGGWRTDSGEPHTYEFSIRGDQVRGIYCTHCSDATTLAFIDGKFGPDGITFVVTHVKADGSTAYQDRATARFDKGNLTVTGTSGGPNGGKFQRTVIKDPRGPDPLPLPVSKLPAGNGPVPAITFGGGGRASTAWRRRRRRCGWWCRRRRARRLRPARTLETVDSGRCRRRMARFRRRDQQAVLHHPKSGNQAARHGLRTL